MADKKMGYCNECKYWYSYDKNRDEDLKAGECRRYPVSTPCIGHINDIDIPALEGLVFGTPLLSHPFTYGNDWCGEFVEEDEESLAMKEW